MNVLFISQCSKKALTETRRILDQFAERRGDCAWQTAITQQGLESVHRLLRQSARKNTAVACHWIRGKDHSELVWVVGDQRRFNACGATPTNSTIRPVVREYDENDWHSAEDIRLLARIGALFHDLGKANDAFQKKLTSGAAVADAFRHEWVSLRLFEAFVGGNCKDRDWLERLTRLDENVTRNLIGKIIMDGQTPGVYSPFKVLLSPLARAVGWLIVSHHRLPTPGKEWAVREDALKRLPGGVVHEWCGSCFGDLEAKASCWSFSGGLPFDSRHWRQHMAITAESILKRPSLCGEETSITLNSPYVLHLSRMALMLADHYYSGQPSKARYGDPQGSSGKILFANTIREKGKAGERPKLNQRLDEHLIGVEVNAGRLVQALPRLGRNLPRIARHQGFRARSSSPYRWQNAAFDLAESLHYRSEEHGFFGVNLASTGCGKTFANARILYGLANPKIGARFTVALGLRTLTLQTGDAYRERLNLGPEDLAVLAGGQATKPLHAYYQARARAATGTGSESALDLMPENMHVRYEGSLEDGPLRRWLQEGNKGGRQRNISLLDAPVLVCTIDHLMPATESTRGGHQILPMLRLMSSDLVLDEPDDFDIGDLPALTRLVHWTGMLGSRVLLSSATLPPSLARGLFLAYCAGRQEFQNHRGRPGAPLAICCAWFDEFQVRGSDHAGGANGASFCVAHEEFVKLRIACLAERKEASRRAKIISVPIAATQKFNDKVRRQAEICEKLATILLGEATGLHRQHHSTDPATGKRVSFGLIRMANIDPLFDVARSLFASRTHEGYRIHLCVYHSRHPLLIRAEIEKELDTVLKRHNADAVFSLPTIRERLSEKSEGDHIFIVLATAVAEVGRDHDYDWAIVEPSSMRSIIQLAGRVKRHRKFDCPIDKPNIALLDFNVKQLKHPDAATPAFRWPGFESADFPLRTHRLTELLVPEQWQTIDARPRILPRESLNPRGNLVDLEHARLSALMLGAAAGEAQKEKPVKWWWETHSHLTGILQKETPFRFDPQDHGSFVFLPDENCESAEFNRLEDNGAETPVSNLLQRLTDAELFPESHVSPWGAPDYLTVLQSLASELGLDAGRCARKFGLVDLPNRDAAQRWRYHPSLGFSRA